MQTAAGGAVATAGVRTAAAGAPADPARGPTISGALAGLAAVVAGSAWALGLVHRPGFAGAAPGWFWVAVVALWAAAWFFTDRLARARAPTRAARLVVYLVVPLSFGLTVLVLWELVTVGAGVPSVLMPAPSAIGARLAGAPNILFEDFVQTVLRAVIPGWAIGSAAGILIAILCDRVPFLQRGLIPLGHFVSALPLIGIAPIMVMWFGFDWQSKVAVVVVMTFFPALVNTVAGLSASGHLERDLMRSYGSSYAETLVKLRLPAAMPFIFNALKINSTLALIGAIVAEFFGTPIVGMGFRISTEVGRMSLDMVWAEIAVAAVTGSLFYALVAVVERLVTFWHPSYRAR
jgi:NitT/TauT family transport system permease protein